MIGDIIHIKEHHLPPAREIVNMIKKDLQGENSTLFSITVGGESGSGKSTLSLAIEKVLEEHGKKCFIFHMDDYFVLPPKDNHNRRLANINNVGSNEVNLDLLQQHIDQAKQGIKKLRKPLVHYRENRMRDVIVELNEADIIIAEGTYVTLLERINCRVFMQRNYLDTYESRVKRARDPIIPFNEKVLKIEHQIVKKHKDLANILVDKNYNVRANNQMKSS